MLSELRGINQPAGEPRRRWFSSSDMDLIVWFSDYHILGFQLCYDKGTDEHAFTWMEASGCTHRRIEDGEQKGAHHKMTPILVPDGVVDHSRILRIFRDSARAVDQPIRDYVERVLLGYCGPE